MQVIEVTDAGGAVVAPQWLALAEGVHRQLRTALPADYAATLRGVFRDGGRMCVAVDEEAVRGVAVYRTQTNTFSGRFLYVDDLVTDDRGYQFPPLSLLSEPKRDTVDGRTRNEAVDHLLAGLHEPRFVAVGRRQLRQSGHEQQEAQEGEHQVRRAFRGS